MRNRLSCFFAFLLLCFQGAGALGFEITRDSPGTQLIFENTDFEKPHGDKHFENEWLVKDLRYRPSCFLHSPVFSLPHRSSIDVVVYYEGCWRDLIDEVSDLSELDVARFDLAYEDVRGKFHRESHYLPVSDLGNLMWLAKGSDFTQVRARTSDVQTIHMKTIQIPAASRNIRVQMCAIGPQARIRVARIELKISDADEFLKPLTATAHSALKCFDTGLFLANCRVEETVLDDSGLAEMRYKAYLNYTCRGHEVELALASDSMNKTIFPSPNEQVVEVLGRHLRLVDINESKTRRSTFDHGCVLKINRLNKSLSKRQNAYFTKAKKDLEKAIDNSKVSAQAFVDLHLLAQAIEAIKVSLDFVSRTTVFTNTFAKNITLATLLSKRQYESLKTLIETKKILTQSDSHYDRFKKLEEEAHQGLRILECLMNDSIEHEGENHVLRQ